MIILSSNALLKGAERIIYGRRFGWEIGFCNFFAHRNFDISLLPGKESPIRSFLTMVESGYSNKIIFIVSNTKWKYEMFEIKVTKSVWIFGPIFMASIGLILQEFDYENVTKIFLFKNNFKFLKIANWQVLTRSNIISCYEIKWYTFPSFSTVRKKEKLVNIQLLEQISNARDTYISNIQYIYISFHHEWRPSRFA